MGPILGQRVHFEIFAEERYPPAIERYRRLSEEVSPPSTSAWPDGLAGR